MQCIYFGWVQFGSGYSLQKDSSKSKNVGKVKKNP